MYSRDIFITVEFHNFRFDGWADDSLPVSYGNRVLLSGMRRDKGGGGAASGTDMHILFVSSDCAVLRGSLSVVYGVSYSGAYDRAQMEGWYALPESVSLDCAGDCSVKYSRQGHCPGGV